MCKQRPCGWRIDWWLIQNSRLGSHSRASLHRRPITFALIVYDHVVYSAQSLWARHERRKLTSNCFETTRWISGIQALGAWLFMVHVRLFVIGKHPNDHVFIVSYRLRTSQNVTIPSQCSLCIWQDNLIRSVYAGRYFIPWMSNCVFLSTGSSCHWEHWFGQNPMVTLSRLTQDRGTSKHGSRSAMQCMSWDWLVCHSIGSGV